MNNFFLVKKTDAILISVLFFIYIVITVVAILGIGNLNFLYLNHLGYIEILSTLIFLSSLYLGFKNIKFYAVLLVFNIIALPSSIDNVFPSVLISAPCDLKNVYFPLVTHIDIYLVIGIIRFWINKNSNKIYFKGVLIKLFFFLLFLLFISMITNLVEHDSIYNAGLILSHSYHLRYILLLLVLFGNTEIIKHNNLFFLGIGISVIFLILESVLFSYIFNSFWRLISGTLGNNVFGNILSAITCFYTYLTIRKYLSIKYYFLILIMVFCVFLTETRSAIFLLLIYSFSESIIYIFNLFKQKFNMKAFTCLFSLLLIFTVLFFSQNERLYLNNFKVEKINFKRTNLNEIIVLEKNHFNASLILRLNHFQTSLNMIKQEPLFGIGSGRWNRYKQYYGSTDNHVMDSHNDFLALASQYGLLMSILLCFYIFIFPFLLFMRKQSIERDKRKVSYLFIINIVMMFAGITNSGLYKNQIFGFLALILVFYIFNLTENEKENSHSWY